MNRSDMIKKTAGIFSAAAMMFSFAGCQNNNTESTYEEKTSVTEPAVTEELKDDAEYTVSQLGTEQDFNNIELISYLNDKVLVFEQPGGSDEKEFSQIFDITAKEVKDADLSVLDYMYIQFAVMDNGRLYILYTDNENRQNLCTFDIDGNKVISDKLVPDDQMISCIRADGKGNFTAIKTMYTDQGKIFYVVTYDSQTLDETKEIALTGKVFESDSEEAFDAFAGEDGSFYVFSVDYGMDFQTNPLFYKIDSENNVIFKRENFEDWKGYFAGMAVNDKGNLYICAIDDATEYLAYNIDKETGETIDKHNFSTSKSSSYINTLSLPGYDISYMTSAGITGYSFEKDKEEVVLSFGTDIRTELNTAYNVSSSGNSVYMYNLAYVESGRIETVIDSDGKIVSRSELPVSRGYASAFCVTDDETVIYSETYDPGAVMETVSGYNTAYIFRILAPDGNLKSMFSIDDVDALGDAVIRSISTDSDGKIYMLFQIFDEYGPSSVVYVTDSTGKILHRFEDAEQIRYISDVSVTEGDDFVLYNQDDGIACAKFDYDNNKYITCPDITVSGESVIVNGIGNYDFCYFTPDTVYGCNVSEGKEDKLFDLSAAGIKGEDILKMTVVSEDVLLCSVYDSESGNSEIIKINKN